MNNFSLHVTLSFLQGLLHKTYYSTMQSCMSIFFSHVLPHKHPESYMYSVVCQHCTTGSNSGGGGGGGHKLQI